MKSKKDRILSLEKSPLAEELLKKWDEEAPDEVKIEGRLDGSKTRLSGKMEIGAAGHPVSILVMDEVTGAELEFNHVHNALLMVEEKRRGSSGWVSLVAGSVGMIKPVLEMIATATLDELKRLVGRKKGA